jgi:hypothetical protein
MGKLADVQKLYDHFFQGHADNISALAQILDSSLIEKDTIPLISAVVRLWDDFDADVQALIVGALEELSRKIPLSEIPGAELSTQVFLDVNRRRLLRVAELQRIFPQLSFPIGYEASWLSVPKHKDNPKIIDWLKQYALVSNPFGSDDLKNYPFYPDGFARPDQWETFLDPLSLFAYCPTAEDAKALAFLLRAECLPVRKDNQHETQVMESKMQVFPIWVSLEHPSSSQLPLPALAHSAARSWLEILPSCPDAMLDLLLAEQQTLLELLCWSIGSNGAVISLMKRAGLKDNAAGRVMIRKISDFESKFSSAHLPQESVLFSWLKIKPPELNQTYLILPNDDFYPKTHPWWFETFSFLIPALFLNGIVTKAMASVPMPVSLSLPEIGLSWSCKQLGLSLDHQFDAATELGEARTMGIHYHFHELFGPGATEEQTTQKLISASVHSLGRMLMLGHRLLQKHCEQEVPEKYLSTEELDAILK